MIADRKYFICFLHHGIGGAEKRISAIWKAVLAENPEVSLTLVAPATTLEALLQLPELRTQEVKIHTLIFDFHLSSGPLAYRKQARTFLRDYTSPKDKVHFIGIAPWLPFTPQKLLLSVTESSLKNLSWKGQLSLWVSMLFCSKIDILDPIIWKQVRTFFFFKKNSITRTPGSHCDVSIYTAQPFQARVPRIVFLGRFEEGKQLIPYVHAIPKLYAALKEKVPQLEFGIYGSGSQQAELEALLRQPEFRSVPIDCRFITHPAEVLATSWVFLSLQKHNNYPSKSLMEAMACGNIPLVTDCGTTDLLVQPSFGFFVPEQFTSTDLLTQLEAIFSLSKEETSRKSKEARSMIAENYSIGNSIRYYSEFWFN